ncbi:DNA primase catalytic subunit PriS [Methanofollis aquaemaris]|uniref:DNA primase small subunit PriS n=1 Tax=Methanofollis aquaemaris TaxID=126734 RepID=A0A8A3S4M2_9EURY|nr:DNA primase catalytic subunit PriS [Methanofollis aquaemaris]QSZ66819.1 DNA primase catalytic subunit PriS [Methanofollis aquaemaris]
MKPATLEFLNQRFNSYYRENFLAMPPGLQQREWGFVFFGQEQGIRMRRHLGFGSREECTDYIRSMAPAHAYYSTAYYTDPGAGTMGEKGWTGADLIFDIDADHLVKGVPYDAMLARVKEETEKLLTMLTEELGFSRKSLTLVFSGGRGYHVHVRDPRVLGWESQERREIVDYLCATGLAPGSLFAMGNSGGWQGRFASALQEYANRLFADGEKAARKHLLEMEGVGEIYAGRFLASMQSAEFAAGRIPRDLLSSSVLQTLLSGEGGELIPLIKDRAALVDEPVTTDIKRLIRMPTSLHGGSGLRVVEVPLKELPDFDPLVDAVVFSEREVKVDAAFGLSMPILGKTYTVKKGTNLVPEALAVFLCCRGIAEIGGGRR